jgi:hypothetical protein
MADKKIAVADIEPLVEKYNGNVAAIARALGVNRSTVWARVQESVTLKAALENAREAMLDNAESVLYQKVLIGSTPELLFFLKTQGKRRGYTEKLEVIVEQRVREELGGRLDALANELDAETYQHVLAILAGS